MNDFQHEGEFRCKKILTELQKVESREHLAKIEPLLKKHFESLIELIIQAREFQEKHVEDVSQEIDLANQTVSFQLEEELRRIFEIEGGREIIERSQQEALIKLDAFERIILKKKQFYKPSSF